MMAEIQGLDYVLRKWREKPDLSKKEIIRWHGWEKDTSLDNNKPFSQEEIENCKKTLKKLSPMVYQSIFSE